MTDLPGLYGKKLRPAEAAPPVPVVLAPGGAAIRDHLHDHCTNQNPTTACSRCGAPATRALELRWLARQASR